MGKARLKAHALGQQLVGRDLRSGIAQADAQGALPRLAKIERMAGARVRGHQYVLTGSLRPLNGIDERDLLARENLGDGLGKLIPAGLAARKHGANKYHIAELEVLGVRLANKVEVTHDQARFGTERDGGKRIGRRGDERLHGRRDREHGIEGRRKQRALGSAAPLVGAPANNRAGRCVADSDNEIVAGNAVSRKGAKDGIGIGQRSTGRRNIEDEQRHSKAGVDERMLNNLAKALRCGVVPNHHRALRLAHSRGKHARQLIERAQSDADIDTAVLEIDQLTANHSSPRSKSISAQR